MNFFSELFRLKIGLKRVFFREVFSKSSSRFWNFKANFGYCFVCMQRKVAEFVLKKIV